MLGITQKGTELETHTDGRSWLGYRKDSSSFHDQLTSSTGYECWTVKLDALSAIIIYQRANRMNTITKN